MPDTRDSDTPDVFISFVADPMSAQMMAGDLCDFLAIEAAGARVTRHREDPLAMDFGATLAIILGSSSVTALATGLAAWLRRRQDAHLQLRRRHPDGTVDDVIVDGRPGARHERIITQFLDS